MISSKRCFFLIYLFVITSILIGCAKIPDKFASRIEDAINKSNPEDLEDKFNLGLIMLFDSDDKEARFFTRELIPEKEKEKENHAKSEKEIETKFGHSLISNNVLENEAATAIQEVSSASILGFSEIVINGVIYKSCQHITVNNQRGKDLSRLICPISKNQEKEQLHHATNEILDKDIVSELRKFSGIEKIKFVIFNDYKIGQTKFYLASPDYFSLEISFPLFLTKDSGKNPQKITNWNNWNVITYRQNPCKQCREEGGKLICEYFKNKSC